MKKTPIATCKTNCRICVSFCGLEVETDEKQVIRIRPDQENTFNWKDFCQKGASANKVRDHPKRLKSPMKRIGDRYVSVSYDQAIEEIAAQLSSIRKEYGAQAIASYIGNPGMSSTTNAMFQSGFMTGLGSDNNYTVGSVDQNGLHWVSRRMYGSEWAFLIPDIDHAKCLLFVGMNPAVSNMGWMYSIANGWNRVLEAQANGADLIVVDPRQTPTTRKANTHVCIRPGEDWAFLLAIIKLVFENNWHHKRDCSQANGIARIKEIAAGAALSKLSEICQVSLSQIEDVAKRFALAESGLCVARTGVAHHRNGTLGIWLSHVLNLITGRVDRKGGMYYQPGIFKNSMKVMDLLMPPVKRRSRIGNFEAIAGGFPVATLADEITTPGSGQVRALIVNSGNPVVSGPDGAKLDSALQQLDLLIAIDLFQRESHRHAHWLIPGCHFLEREDFFTMVGMLLEKPYAQLGQAVIEPLEGIKPEWVFFRDLALAMNIPFMGVPGITPMIRSSLWLSKITQKESLAFNPRWIWAFMVDRFSNLKWKDIVNSPSGFHYGEKTYGHFRRSLLTHDRKIHAAPREMITALCERLSEYNDHKQHIEYPFLLVNQRRPSMMNSWLVETVKRKSALGDHIEMNPEDALLKGIEEGQPVVVSSHVTSLRMLVRLTTEVPPGIVSIDHGWGSRLFDPINNGPAEVSGIMRNVLIASDDLDEITGIPKLNGTRVSVLPI